MQIFTNQQSNGESDLFKNLVGSTGRVNVYISGDLGGGTIQVQALTPDGSEWVPVTGGEITNPGLYVIDSGYFVGRLTFSGATTPSVNAWAVLENSVDKLRVMQS